MMLADMLDYAAPVYVCVDRDSYDQKYKDNVDFLAHRPGIRVRPCLMADAIVIRDA